MAYDKNSKKNEEQIIENKKGVRKKPNNLWFMKCCLWKNIYNILSMIYDL